MPVHDWTRIDAGIFHDFHSAWITEVRNALNGGLLPPDYYALAEQHATGCIADILTLHAPLPEVDPTTPGGVAVAEAPPQVRLHVTASATVRSLRRTLTIRHVSGHRIVALLEVVSPANKDRASHVLEFAEKLQEALSFGIHVLLVDLIPPGPHDLQGMHGALWSLLDESEGCELPEGEPLTLASYVGGEQVEAHVEYLAVGGTLIDMPLFLNPDRYVNVPLQATYDAAYRGVPAFWRNVLERA